MIRRILLYFLYVVAVIALIVGLVIAFGSDNSNDDAPAKTESGQETSQKADETGMTATTAAGTQTVTTSSGTQTSNTSTGSQSSGTQTANTAAGAQASTQLTDSGPGSTLIMFVVASVIGFCGFRYRLIKHIG